MKNIMSYVVATVVMVAGAHSQQDELAVTEKLVRMIMSSPEWDDNLNIDSMVEGVELPFQRYEDLFQVEIPTNQIGSDWSQQDRKLAFENFIESIPVLSTNGMYRAIKTHGVVALSYCRDHGASNVLSSAEAIVLSRDSVAHAAALSVMEEFATPSCQFNAYAMSVLTNSEMSSSRTRSYFKATYAEILRKRRNVCEAESFTNGVMNLYRVVAGGTDGAVALDRLLVETFPEYQESRQRLSLANAALQGRHAQGVWSVPAIEGYFIPITNQLMNATQPLPEVEALRGL